MPNKSFRTRFEFWLDLEKQDQYHLAETIEKLKAQRAYSRTIRNGIRLITDLEQGSTEVLFELYPHLRENLAGGGIDTDTLARIESLLNGNGNGQEARPEPAKVEFTAADAIEAETTEDYIESAFEDLEELGF